MSELLQGYERPVVIARRRPGAAVAESVAPASADLGVMLPYSPLHHLLLADVGTTLVMTSANVSDEPIAYEDTDALARLGGIADLFLAHDRPIHMRTDDSVVRSTARGALLLRRSRGYVPRSLRLPVPTRPLLACGAELKSTFCLAKDEAAWVGHHIGDLKNWETLRSFREGIEHFERLFAVAPEIVAHDLHPDYLATREALEREGVEHVGVQHHHAHLAACLAEHGETGPAVGAIFDGTGFSPDGTAWGGELLVGDLVDFERAGMLFPVRLPGGDRAAIEPWRMACAWLVAALDAEPPLPAALAGQVTAERWATVARMARTGTGSPLTTSAGRLFDALAALCGLRSLTTYEGQAAAELESALDPAERGAYELPLAGGDPLVMDARPAVLEALADIRARRCRRRRERALPQRAGRGYGRRVRAAGRGPRTRDGGTRRRRVPEPRAAGAHRRAAGASRPARPGAHRAAAERRRHLVRAGGGGGGQGRGGAERHPLPISARALTAAGWGRVAWAPRFLCAPQVARVRCPVALAVGAGPRREST